MQLELNINKESPNFDTVRAEVMAHEIDDVKEGIKKTSTYFNNEIVDKVFLESAVATREANKYAVATFNGKEIHLTSLKGNNNKVCKIYDAIMLCYCFSFFISNR